MIQQRDSAFFDEVFQGFCALLWISMCTEVLREGRAVRLRFDKRGVCLRLLLINQTTQMLPEDVLDGSRQHIHVEKLAKPLLRRAVIH